MKKILINFSFILTVLALTTGCTGNTANLKEVKVCAEMYQGRCQSDTSVFSSITPEIFLSTTLKNAPIGTTITFQWNYLSNGTKDLLDEVQMDTPANNNTHYLYSSYPMPLSGSWPLGQYEVVISTDGDAFEPFSKTFEIK